MGRFVLSIILVVTFVTCVLASESRLEGLNAIGVLVEDPFNIAYLPGYVNTPYNFLILEPRQGTSGIFDNTYGILKYSIVTPVEKLNLCVIVNFPYPELGRISLISTGIPPGFLVPGTTGLTLFTLTDHTRDMIDVLCGLDRIVFIDFIKPYIGFGYAGDYSVTTTSTTSDGTITSTTTNVQSISQVKVILGSALDLAFISLDVSAKVYFPSARNSSESFEPGIANYLNSRVHRTEGSIGFDVSIQPKLKLGEKTYLLGFGKFFNYSLPSSQETKRNPDGTEPVEESTKIINNYHYLDILIGASYNTHVGGIFISVGTMFASHNTSQTIKAEGTALFGVTLLTNTNEAAYYEYSSYVPVFVSFEVPLVDWFVVRAGVYKNVYYVGSYVEDEKKFNNTISTSEFSYPVASLSAGFSLKPIKGLSLDWVIRYTFLNDVVVGGRLPWIISGNQGFDNLTSQVSVEYRM